MNVLILQAWPAVGLVELIKVRNIRKVKIWIGQFGGGFGARHQDRIMGSGLNWVAASLG